MVWKWSYRRFRWQPVKAYGKCLWCTGRLANLDENLGAGNYETYQVNADGTKSLLDGYQCGGLGIAGDESDIDIRLQWGYAGGNFYYGGTIADYINEIYQRTK